MTWLPNKKSIIQAMTWEADWIYVIQVMTQATYDLNDGLLVQNSGHGLNNRPFG